MALPITWNVDDKSDFLNVDSGRLKDIRYTVNIYIKNHEPTKILCKLNGQGKDNEHAAAIRANHPILPQCGLFYFEIDIINKGQTGIIGIGFCTKTVDLNVMPGWRENSWGYHGDDGKFFCEGFGDLYGPLFTTGDTIGCYLNFANNTVFYTKNGVNLGLAFRDLKGIILYPFVGLRSLGGSIEANFGHRKFKYAAVTCDDIDDQLFQKRWDEAYDYETNQQIDKLTRLNEFLIIVENHAFKLRYKGKTYFILGKYKEALECLTELLDIEQNDEFALRYRGETYFIMEKYKESLTDIKRLLEIKTNDSWGLKVKEEVARGMVHDGILYEIGFGVEKDIDMAYINYKQSANIGNPTAIESLNRLANLIWVGDRHWSMSESRRTTLEDDERINRIKYFRDIERKRLMKQDWIHDSKRCEECRKFYNPIYSGWCKTCNSKHLENTSPKSGNPEIDEFLRKAESYINITDRTFFVRYLGFSQDPKKNYMIVMEKASCDLHEYLKHNFCRMNWEEKITALLDISIGLDFLHNSKLVHRDLHSRNILFGNGNVFLITDLGLCQGVNQCSEKTFGDVHYVAPEVLNGNGYTQAADVYSFGIVACEVVTGCLQYHATYENKDDLKIQIIGGHRPIIPDDVQDQLRDLINQCLNKDEYKRPTAGDLHSTIRKLYKDIKQLRNNSKRIFNTKETKFEKPLSISSCDEFYKENDEP
ncbi:4487_t:CDS:2, partial [Acaulospora morrowiae]